MTIDQQTVPSTQHSQIEGRFASGIASGTLHQDVSFSSGGTSYSCVSGTVSWTATRTG